MNKSAAISEGIINCDTEVESVLNENIEPRRSMCYHEYCVWRVRSAPLHRGAFCEVI